MTSISTRTAALLLTALLGFASAAQAAPEDDLRQATRNGSTAQITALLSEGADPNLFMENGDTLFTYAMRSDAPEAARVIMDDPRFKMNLANRFGETPLMLAVFKGQKPIFEALLARGADVNGAKNWTALHYAATEGRDDFVKALIEKGADVNAQTTAGVTALHMAARKPDRAAVMTLLRAGAYRDLCTDRGLSPADFAKNAGDEELGKYLAVERCAYKGPRPKTAK